MTVDVRARVFCNLSGAILQGSLADETLTTGQGLVTCRGQVVLSGLSTPTVGSIVRFGWERDGEIARIPRTLRVLSSFADPFRGITTVQLGDKLVYLANLRGKKAEEQPAAPEYGPQADQFPPDQYDWDAINQCYLPEGKYGITFAGTSGEKATVNEENAYAPATIKQQVPLSISAEFVLLKCLAALGIGKSGSSLIARFTQEEFDLSSGYVSVIDRLLNNESLFGYLNEDETLVVSSLLSSGGAGPLLTGEALIDLSGINAGILPGQLVTVAFDSKRLQEKEPAEPTAPADPNQSPEEVTPPEPGSAEDINRQREWEYDRAIAYNQDALFYLEDGYEVAFRFAAETHTYTYYDKENYVTRRVTVSLSILAAEAGSVIQALLQSDYDRNRTAFGGYNMSSSISALARQKTSTVAVEEYEYKLKPQPVELQSPEPTLLCPAEEERIADQPAPAVEKILLRQTTTTFQSALPILAKLNVQGIDWTEVSFGQLPSGLVTTERVVVSYASLEDAEAATQLVAEDVERKQVTERYMIYGQLQSGQQDTAQKGMFTSTTATLLKLFDVATQIRLVSLEVQTFRGRDLFIQKRPSATERQSAAAIQAPAVGANDETSADGKQSLVLEQQSSDSETIAVQTLEMPYGSDDGWSWSTSDGLTFEGSTGAVLAYRYAQSQNAVMRGSRHGVSLQVHARSLPLYPLQMVYLQAAGLTAAYKANGMSWSINSDGVLCGMDALYWGAVSGSLAQQWVPVAPGVGTLPTNPAVITGTGAASNSAETPEGFDPLVPGAIWDYLPVGLQADWQQSIAPSELVAPVDERVPLVAGTRHRLIVRSYDWSLELDPEAATVVSRAAVTPAVGALTAVTGALTSSGQAAGFSFTRRLTATPGATVLAGQGSGYVRNLLVGSNVGSFALSGSNAGLICLRPPMPANVGAFVTTGSSVTLDYRPLGLAADVGSFNSTGESAQLLRSLSLVAAEGSLSFTGQSTALTAYKSGADILFYTGTGSARSVTGAAFQPGFIAFKGRNNNGHAWFNVRTGTSNYIRAGENYSQQGTSTALTSFNSDGFSVGTSAFVNTNAVNYLALIFPTGGSGVSNTAGTITTTVSAQSQTEFSVFTYTGIGGSSQTIGHGLSGAPDFVLVKPTASGGLLAGAPAIGNNYYMSVGGTSATPTSSTLVFQSFNSSTITIGSSINASSATYVVFAFKAKPGTSDISSFTGSGSGTHTVTLGYKPKALLLKNISTTANDWLLFYRPAGGTGYANSICWNTTTAEATSTTVQFTNTGFSVDVGGPGNVSGGTTKALYAAWF